MLLFNLDHDNPFQVLLDTTSHSHCLDTHLYIQSYKYIFGHTQRFQVVRTTPVSH